MVVLLMGLAYALAPRLLFSGVSGADLKAGSRDVAAGLRTARAEAVNGRKEVAFVLDLDQRSFSLTGRPESRQLVSGIDLKLYTAQSELVSDRRGAIRFVPDGSSTGGRVTVASGERKFEVDVDWLTGKVTIGP